jgi:hypothetical protein
MDTQGFVFTMFQAQVAGTAVSVTKPVALRESKMALVAERLKLHNTVSLAE